MDDSSKNPAALTRGAKAWRVVANVVLGLTCVIIFCTAVVFAIFPDVLFGDSDIKPTAESRLTAWIVLVVAVIVGTVIAAQRSRGSSEAVRAEQKAELWGGAAGIFLLFTLTDHVKDDGINGLFGALGLILLLVPAVMLEPLAVALKEREAADAEKLEAKRHAELLAALAEMKSSPTPDPSSAPARLQGPFAFLFNWFRRR